VLNEIRVENQLHLCKEKFFFQHLYAKVEIWLKISFHPLQMEATRTSETLVFSHFTV
jgi:hypothetical protein